MSASTSNSVKLTRFVVRFRGKTRFVNATDNHEAIVMAYPRFLALAKDNKGAAEDMGEFSEDDFNDQARWLVSTRY